METRKEILNKYQDSYNGIPEYTEEQMLKALKEYGEQVVDLCTEEAIWEDFDMNQEAILKVKELLK